MSQAPESHGPPPQYAPAPPEKKKRKKWPIVLLVLTLLTIAGIAGCAALLGGAAKSIDTSITESSEKNAPREVTVGEAFTVGSHETLKGWKVVKDTALSDKGEFQVTGKMKNVSDATSTAFIHFKFITTDGEVIGNVDCSSEDLEPGQTQTMSCLSDGEWGKYDKITAEADF